MVNFDRFKLFLYYKDLESAKRFYREILGMKEYRESEHVWQYWVTPDARARVMYWSLSRG